MLVPLPVLARPKLIIDRKSETQKLDRNGHGADGAMRERESRMSRWVDGHGSAGDDASFVDNTKRDGRSGSFVTVGDELRLLSVLFVLRNNVRQI